jgi:predicted DNA-binding transcriptional regulator AlpA
MSATNELPYLTLGQVAERLGCQSWQVLRLFQRGLLPEPPRIGINRVVHRDRIPEIKAALEKAGFLKRK